MTGLARGETNTLCGASEKFRCERLAWQSRGVMRRAHIHAQRDRLYYLPDEKKPVAHNRRKRCDQGDVDSLAEFRKARPQDVGRLKVKRAVRLYIPNRAKAPAVGGDVWNIGGRRVVAQGVHSKTNLYVPDLKRVTGKVYASPKDGVRLFWNSGMVRQQLCDMVCSPGWGEVFSRPSMSPRSPLFHSGRL